MDDCRNLKFRRLELCRKFCLSEQAADRESWLKWHRKERIDANHLARKNRNFDRKFFCTVSTVASKKGFTVDRMIVVNIETCVSCFRGLFIQKKSCRNLEDPTQNSDAVEAEH